MIRHSKRQTGETQYLINKSAELNYPIIVVNNDRKRYIVDRARALNILIPEPMTISNILADKECGKRFEKVIIDNAEEILSMIIWNKLHTSVAIMSFKYDMDAEEKQSLFSKIINIFKKKKEDI